MTEVEKYVAMQGFKQDLSAMRYQAASQAQTYRSQQLVARWAGWGGVSVTVSADI